MKRIKSLKKKKTKEQLGTDVNPDDEIEEVEHNKELDDEDEAQPTQQMMVRQETLTEQVLQLTHDRRGSVSLPPIDMSIQYRVINQPISLLKLQYNEF